MSTEFPEWHFHVIGIFSSVVLQSPFSTLVSASSLTPTPRSVSSSGCVFACWPHMSFSFSSLHHCLPDAVFCSVDFLPTFVRHCPRAPLILFVDVHTLTPSLRSASLPPPFRWPALTSLCSTQEPPAASDPLSPLCYAAQWGKPEAP